MNKTYDVVGIGNAIVDVLAFTDDAFLAKEGLAKGSMMLIDEARADALYSHMSQSQETSGGSAANTLAGMASLGAKTAFIGKVRDDQLGEIFRHDLRSVGVDFDTKSAQNGKATARSFILVTPDAERTMNTYLGACNQIDANDIDEKVIAQAKVVYGEGYLWDEPAAKAALRRGFELAKKHGAKVAFTLSDVFCVERHREEFLQLLEAHFDILFANEKEIESLFPGKSFEEILTHVQGKADIIAITRSDKGSIIVTPNERIEVKPKKVAKLVDSTGAGDLYAAGFLYGYTQGLPLARCGEIGSACASEIIQHMGARSLRPLKELVA